ncbi:condensation domain-containing protein [Erwinia amylovora]
MSNSLMPDNLMPLVAAQPGIWMAEQLSPVANAWSVAHYVELNGVLDEALLSQAVVAGMEEADTLRMRFSEQEGVPVQWIDLSARFMPPRCVDLRQHQTPQQSALALMQQDLDQDLRISGCSPVYHHCVFRLSDSRWFWYQR